MSKKVREPRVYYFQKFRTIGKGTERKKIDESILIFDAGYEGGLIHFYRHAYTIHANQLQDELAKLGQPLTWNVLKDEELASIRTQQSEQ